jgi:glycerophosphoryl diester phosphodiesterase
MTLEQLKALDFGSWFSSAYAGTKIPTLSEFLVTCRNLGLKAYIELKGLANSSVANLVKEVKSLGMAESVTYICFTYSYLQEVVLADKKARIGYLLNTISETDVQDAVALKTDENEVFIDAANSAVTSESIALAKSYGMPIEQWTAELSEVNSADPYVSGFTSNYTIASDILYSKEIMK